MEWVTRSGRTIAEAKDAALDELGVDEVDAEFEILEEPRQGLFGRQRGEARVRARVRPAVPRPKMDRRTRGTRRKSEGRTDDESIAKDSAPKDQKEPGAKEAGRTEAGAKDTGTKGASAKDASAKGASDKDAAPKEAGRREAGRKAAGTKRSATRRGSKRGGSADPAGEPTDAEPSTQVGGEAGGEAGGEGSAAARPSPEPKPRPADVVAAIAEASEEATSPSARRSRRGGSGRSGAVQQQQTNGGAAVQQEELSLDEQGRIADEFIVGLLERFGMQATTEIVTLDEETVEVRVTGGDLGLLIGPKGQTLQAVQEVARTVVQRRSVSRVGRILVDIAGYRVKRRQALERFTRQVADDVIATGVQRVLEPMSAPDRKIVHDTATDIDGVRTLSEGEEPHRRVVIIPAGVEREAGEPAQATGTEGS